MTHIHPIYFQRERKRFIRPDAHRYLRADWRRYLHSGQKDDSLFKYFEQVEFKYSPDQPRVPRGRSNGGQWTTADEGSSGRNDPRVISDAAPSSVVEGTQYAQSRPRGGFSSVIINGQRIEPTPGQQARLAVVEARARDAIRRVQEFDSRWQPNPSAYESVEGLIGAYESDARQAQNYITELQRVGIGPGPFAGESIPARGSITAADRREINRIGAETGCNTCGTLDPGTLSRNFVADHQPPTGLNSARNEQRLYPQCLSCSVRQGGWVTFLKRRP
jgi:hypothetical protein